MIQSAPGTALLLIAVGISSGCGGAAEQATVPAASPTPVTPIPEAADRTPASSRDMHATLTQFHRWFQLYERPRTDALVQRQLEILDPDVEVSSRLGTARGHQQYVERVAGLSNADKNSHVVTASEVSELDPDRLLLEASVRYLRLPEGGAVQGFDLRYRAELRRVDGSLPVFTKIDISLVGAIEAERFRDAYVENRARSFLHYWLVLMESLDGDASRFPELLATDGFVLDFSTGAEPMTSMDALAAWLSTVPTQLSKSSHQVENRRIEGDDEIAVSVDFPWRGVRIDGASMKARTHHDWKLVDTGERFLRLREAKVTALEAFSVVDTDSSK